MDYGSASSYGGYSYGWSTGAAAPPPQQSSTTSQQHHAYAIGDSKPSIGPSSQQQYGQQSQKNVGYWMAPGTKNVNTSATGGFYTPGPGMTGNGTAAGGVRAGMGGGGFPKKNSWVDKKRLAAKKPYDPSGKTPAMLLHELFRNITERYEDVDANTTGGHKLYRCIIVVEGKEFPGDANTKKAAKQKAAEMAVRSLRPEIKVTPFEEAVKEQPPPVAKAEPPKKKAKISGDDSDALLGLAANAKQKAKANPIDVALSLVDLLRKMCLEKEGFNPSMDHTEITEGDLSKVPPNKRRFRFTLSFPSQGREFVKEGFGKTSPKDQAIREALIELFQISDVEIQKVVKRSLSSKVSNMTPIQVLYHLSALFGREVTFTVLEEDKKDVTVLHTGPPNYIATCTVKDPSDPARDVTVTGEAAASKAEARLLAAKIANQKAYDLDVENLPKQPAAPVPACQKLQMLMMKQNRGKQPNIKYEDLSSEADPSGGPTPIFRTKVTINDKDEFIGVGRSKKAAKNQAAHAALKGVFKFDYVEDLNNDPSPHFGVSKLCYEVAEYAKREYYQMCGFYGVRQSTEMAAFFLLNEKNEKRLIAVGSSPLAIVDARKVIGSEGLSLLHLQSIVLARRSLIRYFMLELEKLGDETCVFEKNDEGAVSLKKNLRVVLYSTFAPDVRFSGLDATETSLSCYAAQGGVERSPSDQQTLSSAESNGFLRVHSVADKIFKWCHLGLQGGLLSNIVQPVKLSSVFFGSLGAAEDISLRHSFYLRIGASVSPDTVVETNKVMIRPQASMPHVWTREVEHLETLNLETGRTCRGSPSRVAKAEIFQAFLKLRPELSSLSYGEAKEKAKSYQTMKNMLYKKISEKGLGSWQRKPSKLNDFHSTTA